MRRCKYCHGSIPNGKRLDAQFCDGLCRGRYHRFGPRKTDTDAFPGKRESSRRPTRDGRGARPYLLADELDDFLQVVRSTPRVRQTLSQAGRQALRKLGEAQCFAHKRRRQ